jgi:hypothetical protein
MLISEDLPTLDRPIKANSGSFFPVNCFISVMLETNSACCMSIRRKFYCQSGDHVSFKRFINEIEGLKLMVFSILASVVMPFIHNFIL